jgi:rod shape determining protein RodA
MAERVSYRSIDWFVLGCVAALVAFGILFIQSAQAEHASRGARQLLWAAMGLAAMVAVIQADYMRLMRYAYVIYAATIALLVAVLFTRPVNFASSWFDLGFMKFQPSEIAKIGWLLAMARFLPAQDHHRRLLGLLPPTGVTLLPLALILWQPDLGTAMIFVPAFFTVLYAAGARGAHLGVVALSGAGASGAMWIAFMRDYQKRRVLAWLNPARYATTDAYQMLKSRIAVGSGGLTGHGLGRGEINRLGWVPEKDTDLIFSVVAEEWGFAGSIALIGLFALLVAALIDIAQRTDEPQGRLIAVGVASLVGFQAAVNLWVATGLLPTTGVTLPFVSYGGSSLLVSFVMVGLALNVAARGGGRHLHVTAVP